MCHLTEKMNLEYSWEPIGKRIFYWDFVYESNNTGEITLSSHVNSYYCMHNALML